MIVPVLKLKIRDFLGLNCFILMHKKRKFGMKIVPKGNLGSEIVNENILVLKIVPKGHVFYTSFKQCKLVMEIAPKEHVFSQSLQRGFH